MTEIFTFFTLSELSTRIWINDLLFSNSVFLKSTNLTPTIYLFVLVFGVAFFTAQWLIPQAIRFAHRFQLVDRPSLRKKHINSTPILGGLSVFISVVFAFSFTSLLLYNYPNIDLDFKIVFGLFSAVSLMVFFGLKDDIFEVSPIEKVIFQILTALFVIISCEIRIDNFDGLFGIYELPSLFSYVFSVFVFVIVVNAFNLIDGIDGLSASVGLISTLCFGIFFFLNDLAIQSLMMFCYSGALTSFLIFNFKKRLFLGDNGSMSLGVVIAFGIFSVITVTNGVNFVEGTGYFINNASVIVLALISFPLLDTIRIFCVRLKNGKSPFMPDRNHLHHHLTYLNFSHLESTLLIVIYTIFITGIALALSSWNITSHFFGMLFISSFIYLITWVSKRRMSHKKL
tara:strand:+ start:4784 stop:5980 length:1197 start_codon:yes stop_codon:yes gene_type:complete